ncbi:hypothetical protein ACSXCS_15305 (plasmid) [Clostridium perfringens]
MLETIKMLCLKFLNEEVSFKARDTVNSLNFYIKHNMCFFYVMFYYQNVMFNYQNVMFNYQNVMFNYQKVMFDYQKVMFKLLNPVIPTL